MHCLADDCEYGAVKNNLIHNHIVVGVLCDQLSEKLEAQGSKLTLEEARKAESRTEGKEILRGGRVEAMSHASYRQPRPQHTPKRELLKCTNCGYEQKGQKCFAHGKECNGCGKLGHYVKQCQQEKKTHSKKKYSQKGRVNEVGDDSEKSEKELFLGTLSVASLTSDGWLAPVIVNRKSVIFKLDTGASVTAIGKDAVSRDNKMRAVSRMLRGAGNAPITVLGFIDTVLQYKDKEIKETLYVIEGQQTPLLSRRACEDLGLVKRLDALDIEIYFFQYFFYANCYFCLVLIIILVVFSF